MEGEEWVNEIRRSKSVPDRAAGDLRRLESIERIEAKPPTDLPTSSVIKFFVTKAKRSYLQPWVVQREQECTGTGFVLPNRLIMTNAHVVDHATVVEVKKTSEPRKYRAQVACIGHDLDLAVVRVEDERFWTQPEPVEPIQWGAETGFADLYSEVRAVGFPAGGNTLCVTKGVVSRLDAHLYIHPRLKGVLTESEGSPGNLPILQIDAAINPGNSGGPTFDETNRVIGVASSGLPSAQNIGYIIPTKIAKLFLLEFQSTGRWTGICETGLRTEELESDTMRAFLRMGERTGVMIRSVAPLGAAAAVCKRGDILVAIDDNLVSTVGTISIDLGQQRVDVSFDVLITEKPKGTETKLTLLREGKTRDEVVKFGPIPPLSPRFDHYDSSPQYVIVGGVVFTKMSIPLVNEYLRLKPPERGIFMPSEVINEATDNWRKTPNGEVVVRLRALKHTVNLGYNLSVVAILKRLNGKRIESLQALAEQLEAVREEEFLCFGFEDGNDADEAAGDAFDALVLRAADVSEADAAICEQHRILRPIQLS